MSEYLKKLTFVNASMLNQQCQLQNNFLLLLVSITIDIIHCVVYL